MPRARSSAKPLTDPRLLFEQGLAQSHAGKFQSLQTLAAAEDAYFAAGDRAGAALCAAAYLLTGQAMQSFRGFAERIGRLAGLRDGSLRFDDRAHDLLAHAGLLAGLLMFGPDDPFGARCVERIVALLELDVDVNLKFAAGRVVLFYTEPREQRELGDRVSALLEPLVDAPELAPPRLGRWLTFRLRVTAHAKDRLQLRRAQRQARELVSRHAEPDVTAWLAIGEFDAALPRRDFERASRALATVESVTDPANITHVRRFHWLCGRLALARGEGDAALRHATRARKYSEELELPGPMLGVAVALEAAACLLSGDLAGARRRFEKAADMVAVLHREEMRDTIRMIDAYEALLARRANADTLLRSAFAAARERQFYDSFDTNPRFGATMCALALDRGVEVDFVRRIVELHDFAPPPEAGSSWPWKVHIETLGGFAIVRNGEPMAFAGKAQKKPLDLLKSLIAAGGRGVDKRRIADALWPDAPPDAANAALDMALSRLRKLLGAPAAIAIEDGKLGLNAEHVWVDRWTFDRDVDALQAALRSGNDDDAIAAIIERQLALYRGAFLEHEEPQHWMLAARDRCRNRFLRSLQDAARHWERRSRWADAERLYERGLEVDPLAEGLYRGLMRGHLAQSQPAQAARVYRRCRDLLAAELSVAPSAETEALFRSIPRG